MDWEGQGAGYWCTDSYSWGSLPRTHAHPMVSVARAGEQVNPQPQPSKAEALQALLPATGLGRPKASVWPVLTIHSAAARPLTQQYP